LLPLTVVFDAEIRLTAVPPLFSTVLLAITQSLQP
jgi:hypothetical protein